MKRILACLAAMTVLLTGCSSAPAKEETAGTKAEKSADVTEISLSDNGITVDGKAVSTAKSDAVYTANDIVFYLAGQDFTYGEGTKADEHEQSEADAHTVVHITKAGTYSISGKLSSGQIAVDLGEDAKENKEAVVTLIMNSADITCTVAPAVIFYNVYECGSSDEETASKDVDTSSAGANVIIADGTVNNINGSYVAKIYKSYELNEDGTEVVDSKKLHKYDAAFYSKMSMNVYGGEKGDGVLNINAENEGLDSELHLSVNGGNINIVSGNDGINTNEDNVSVTAINGGNVNIVVSGSTGEGDGIDSNGWLVINGGSVTASACGTSGDAGIDADLGVYLNGGTVCASGNMFDRIEAGEQTYTVFTFAQRQKGGTEYSLKNSDGNVVAKWSPVNDFTYLVVANEAFSEGTYTFWQGENQLSAVSSSFGAGQRPGMQMPDGERPEMPDGEIPEMPEGMTRPEGDKGNRGEFKPENMEGFDPSTMTPPEGMMPPQNGMGGTKGEASTDFVIVKGANMFADVN